MGKHLKTDRWMRKTTTGANMLKRVSAENDAAFPRKYREILRDRGPVSTVKAIMDDEQVSLAVAWDRLKAMVNR